MEGLGYFIEKPVSQLHKLTQLLKIESKKKILLIKKFTNPVLIHFNREFLLNRIIEVIRRLIKILTITDQ